MLLSFVALVASRQAAFTWPPRYTIRGTWNVPYTNLSNPIIISHEPGRQYTNQMNGVEQIWNTNAEDHFHRKIVGAGDKFICFGYNKNAAEWDIELTQFLPDPEGYVTQPGTYTYRGKICKLHTKTLDGGKTQTWQMYTDAETGYPVGYVAKAVSLFQSHYDLYILNIDEFIPDSLPGVWEIPQICKDPQIQDDPYPGNTWNLFFPGKNHKKHGTGKFSHMDTKNWLKTIKMNKRPSLLKRTNGVADIMDDCVQYDGENRPEMELPVNFSYRDTNPMVVGPPRDQVACGSCWAFGTAELLESAIAMKTGKFAELSVNQVMDCTWDNENYGCQGGEVNRALTSMMRNDVEIASERDYPYIGVSGMCMKSSENGKFYKSIGKVKKCYHIGKKTRTVKEALMRFGPLSIGINVVEGMSFYNGGAFNDTTCTGAASDLVHAVILTGWKVIDGVECWEVKNSWSTYWGDEGYVYIQSLNQEWNCGVTTDAVAVEVDVNPEVYEL